MNYLLSPSSSLLYSAISISSFVLMSSSWLYFSDCSLMSQSRFSNCNWHAFTWSWKRWICIALRCCISLRLDSRACFWRGKMKRWGIGKIMIGCLTWEIWWLAFHKRFSKGWGKERSYRGSLQFTLLHSDWSSINKSWYRRLRFVDSDLLVWRISVWATTSLFRSSVCSRHGRTSVPSIAWLQS